LGGQIQYYQQCILNQYAFIDQEGNLASEPKAPMIASGENLYIVWWTNKSGNWEVMFRASNDFGEIIGDKINLSNSTDANSQCGDSGTR
jgi:hypothetical protein